MDKLLIGVISDTHGILRPEAIKALEGSDIIIHAGDIGASEVLEALHRLAPVAAVKGNVDRSGWARNLPETQVVEVGEMRLYVLHDVHALDLDPGAAGFHAVIFGHTHSPHLERRNGVLYLNPGSAGPRRFTLPTTVARLKVTGNTLDVEIVELKI